MRKYCEKLLPCGAVKAYNVKRAAIRPRRLCMKEKQTLPARGTRAPAETCREYPRILPEHDTTRVFRLYVESDLSEGRAYYHEGDYSDASDCAYLYLLIYNDDSAYYFDVADVLMRTSDDFSRILFAGEILYKNGRLSRADYLNYYLAMINDGYEENASNFYTEISLNLNDYEKALFAVQSKRSSDIIVSSLETLYSSDSLSERFIALMKEAIPLLISRGDQEMLLNLISYGTASDPSYCLYIGDLYFSLGNLEMASSYWNSAAKVFPIQVDLRTRTL